jgi:predicted DCC family thiol-disulfide oxidoreductase YuxK
MLHKLFSLNKKKHMLMGASLIRIAFGFIILYNYMIHYSQRYFLWSNDGVISHSGGSFASLSLYHLDSSPVYFNIIFHLGIISTVAFLIGYKGRIASILTFIFTWSLLMKNSVISDGGDNIIRLLLLYLLFSCNTAYFSVDAYLKQSRISKRSLNQSSSINAFSLRNLIHNLAILACLVQVCMLYFTSGLHKAMGELWQSGTALYYILQVEEYTHPFFRDLILSSDFLLVFGSYAAIVVQIAFPFLLANRWTKYAAMLGVIGLHTGIAVVMGLFSFSFIMIANQLLFLTDKEYRQLFAFAKKKKEQFLKKAGLAKARQKSPHSQKPAELLRPIIVFYDGWCPFCIKSINNFQKLDLFNRIEFISFRDDSVIKEFNLDIQMLENRMHSLIKQKSKMEDGIHSINRICKNIPLLWLLVPFISCAARVGLGQKVYDYIASRRTLFPTGGCDAETGCDLPQNK